MGTPRNVYVVYHVFTRDFVCACTSKAKAQAACDRLNVYKIDLDDYKYKRLTVV